MWGKGEELDKRRVAEISKLADQDVYLLHLSRWVYFDTITKEMFFTDGKRDEKQKN